jgi:LAO/AO transport system kinase
MLVAGGGAATGGDRDGADGSTGSRLRPKRPEVLITTAATGAGVPELLAALDRHRASVSNEAAATARLARAEAQVWAIVADRLRDRLHDEGLQAETRETLAAVAAHRLDPYAAADELLGRVVTDASTARRP